MVVFSNDERIRNWVSSYVFDGLVSLFCENQIDVITYQLGKQNGQESVEK